MRLLDRAIDLLLVVVTGWVAFQVFSAIQARWDCNFDIEWMEGATLMSALRAKDGLSLYGPPTPDYIPFIYPPLYAWIVGFLSHFFPFGYALGRMVSIVAMLAGLGALVQGARQEGASPGLAVATAGLYLTCYENAGTFYDLIRVDSVLVALLAWSLVLARRGTPRAVVVSGLCLAGAFATKHNAALFGFPVVLWLYDVHGWRRALQFALPAAVPALLFVAFMEWQSDGWFLTWILEVPAFHGFVADRTFPGLQQMKGSYTVTGAQAELWKALPITTTLGLLALPSWSRRGHGGSYWAWISLVSFVMATLMRGHIGGFINVFMPSFFVQALWPAVIAAGTHSWQKLAVALAVTWQLWEGMEPLDRYVPSNAERKTAAAFVEELRDLPDPLLMPHGPYYAVLAGKQPSFALIALWDVNHEGGPLDYAVGEMEQAMVDHHWATAVVPDGTMGYGLRKGYRKGRTLKSRPPDTKIGWKVKFREVWVPLDGETVAPKEGEGKTGDVPG